MALFKVRSSSREIKPSRRDCPCVLSWSVMGKKYRSSANEMTTQFAEPGRIFWKELDFSMRTRSTDIPLTVSYTNRASTTSARMVGALAVTMELGTLEPPMNSQGSRPMVGGSLCLT